MEYLKLLFLNVCIILLFSCNRRVTTIYYNDTSKVDDGEIFGDGLSAFFKPDQYIFVRKEYSSALKRELKIIIDSLKLEPDASELDDSYYGYAFILSKDTLFANYSLTYWRTKQKMRSLENQKVVAIIKPLFKTPYLK